MNKDDLTKLAEALPDKVYIHPENPLVHCLEQWNGCVEYRRFDAGSHPIYATHERLTWAIGRLIVKHGYNNDNVTPLDWEEWQEAREALAEAKALTGEAK